MAIQKTLVLYGSPSSCDQAKTILENLPSLQLITKETERTLLLTTNSRLNEISLISLLMPSGISGFRLI